MEYIFSNKISSLKPSAIREILKATGVPGMVPFAAGNPSVEAFPKEDIERICADIFKTEPITALQYGVTEGYTPLRQTVLSYMKGTHGVGMDGDEILITSGAQQVMDLLTKTLCNEGDTVICENPSFIGSLNGFRANGCKLAGVPVQSDGMDTNVLEETLKAQRNVKFIYTIPNFQNPAGVTMSLKKRHEVYELARKYDILILEDNPYGDLRVSGEHIPAIKSLDTDGRVIYAGSFSKILSPGLRVGYAIAPKEIIAKMTVCKQTQDVHTPVLNQLIVYKWLKECEPEKHIERICGIYRKKLNLMCDLIDERLGGFFEYVRPEGGLFVWCRLPEGVDMPDFCQRGVKENVAVVPGSTFLTDPNAQTQYVRLNFSTPTDEQIIKGIDSLVRVAGI